MTYTYVDEDGSACRTITGPENCRESFQVENEIGHNRNGTELLPEFDGTVVKRVLSITPASRPLELALTTAYETGNLSTTADATKR
jgi:hypothetical protein